MIVVNDHYMVNPSLVASVSIEKSEFLYGGWYVKLFALGGTKNTIFPIETKAFKTESEAQLFMDYCCEEIDKANGVYKEEKETNNKNIC